MSSPVKYRYSYANRLQNLSMDVLENLYYANTTFVSKDDPNSIRMRYAFQHKSQVKLHMLSSIADISVRGQCITKKQYENICKHAATIQKLIGGWINSDAKRFAHSANTIERTGGSYAK